jgi:hypothetical protein
MSDAYRGEDKTDAKDALVVADQARVREYNALSTPPRAGLHAPG